MLELRPTCAHGVDTVLGNVCPNCGGGFAARPVDPVAHAALLAQLHGLPPEQR